MASLQLLENSQYPKYDNFVNILTEYEMCFIAEEKFVRNIAVKRLLFKRIYDVVHGQLASVVAWNGLYVDVGPRWDTFKP